MRSVGRLVVALFVFALVAAPAVASAAAKSQLMANAIVKSVSGSSVTVTSSGKDATFNVDAKTKVVGKGMGTRSRMKGGKPTIADLLKEGDRVTVTYMDMAGAMHATKIDVAASAATK